MEEKLKIPNHVGIILDGNGRWAEEKGLSRSEGHKAGSKNLNELTEYVLSTGVKVLSVFAFSTENFKRSDEEVNYLMNLFVNTFTKNKKDFHKKNIKIIFSGRKEPLKEEVLNAMDEIMDLTKDNNGGIFNICLNYGGQAEIVDTIKKIHSENIDVDTVNEETLYKYLYNDLPPIDFLIRTGGEFRISNFMLYSIAYAELYFPKIYFPDFNKDEFEKAIIEFNNRKRRFGGYNK